MGLKQIMFLKTILKGGAIEIKKHFGSEIAALKCALIIALKDGNQGTLSY
jgi:hypothetical protein